MKNNFQFSICNFQSIYNVLIFKNLKTKNLLKIIQLGEAGFTIVEILVVAAILGVVGYMMSDIVARSLQGSQKTAVIGNTKQNGQVVLDSISQVIRNSDLVVCIGSVAPSPAGTTSGDKIVFYTQDGRYVRFRYVVTAGNPVKSYIAEDLPNVNFLINNFDVNSSPSRVCDTVAVPVVGSKETFLTDTDPSNGVLIQKIGGTTDIFTVSERPGSNDTVTVQFNVRPSNLTGGFESQLGGSGAVQFQETIQLR